MANPFIPSPQQLNFFKWIENDIGSCALIAVAGAGKTTTLIKALLLMKGNIFFGCYNASAAKDIKARATEEGVTRDGLFISTLHSAGYRAWVRAYPKSNLEKFKVDDIISNFVADVKDPKEIALWEGQRKFITAVVSLGKQFLMGVKREFTNRKVWFKLIEYFQADEDLEEGVDMEAVIDKIIMVSIASHKLCTTIIDYDDMIYAPIAYNLRMFKNDWVLIDEAQDSNAGRRELAKRMLKPGGRLIAVGDPRQAIYGFQGAGSDSLERIMDEFKCREMPLTVTYRCPKAVVQHVRRWVSHIEAHETAPEGEVRTYRAPMLAEGEKRQPWFMHEKPTIEDAVLCRYTAPLVETAFKMIRNGLPCKMEGRDIGNGLIEMATKWKVKTIDQLEEKLTKWLEREMTKAAAKRNEDKAQAAKDKFNTMKVFMDRCRSKGNHTVDCVVAEIQDLFADNVKGILTLCSGHRSKGREWKTVYWMQGETRSRRELLPWEARQEENIKYVMGTRAMERLILLREDTF